MILFFLYKHINRKAKNLQLKTQDLVVGDEVKSAAKMIMILYTKLFQGSPNTLNSDTLKSRFWFDCSTAAVAECSRGSFMISHNVHFHRDKTYHDRRAVMLLKQQRMLKLKV